MIKNTKRQCFAGTMLLSLVVAAIVDSSQQIYAQAKTAGSNHLAFEQNKKLGKGINVNSDDQLRPEDLKVIKDAGFNSIRLVFNYAPHSSKTPPYTVEPAYFERGSWAVQQARSQNLAVVLDFHSFPLLSFNGEQARAQAQHQAPPALPTFEEARKQFLGLWSQIAEHFSKADSEVMFELMNEPSNYLGAYRWNALVKDAINLIRKTNPTRTIVVGTECWQNTYTLESLVLPESDRNIIVAIHFYEPLTFTHQTATYVDGAENWKDVLWKQTSMEQWDVLRVFYAAAAWAIKHNRPLTLNEFGTIGAADPDSRVRWTMYVRQNAEREQMSWQFWSFAAGGNGFGIYDRKTNTWNQPLLNALVPQPNL